MNIPIEYDCVIDGVRYQLKYDYQLKTLITYGDSENIWHQVVDNSSKFFCYYDSIDVNFIKPIIPNMILDRIKNINVLKFMERRRLMEFIDKLNKIHYPLDINEENFNQFLPVSRLSNNEIVDNINNQTFNNHKHEKSCMIFEYVSSILKMLGRNAIECRKLPINYINFNYVGGWTKTTMYNFLLFNRQFLEIILGKEITKCLINPIGINIDVNVNALVVLCQLVIEIKKRTNEIQLGIFGFDMYKKIQIQLAFKRSKLYNLRSSIVNDMISLKADEFVSNYTNQMLKYIISELLGDTIIISPEITRPNIINLINECKSLQIYGKMLQNFRVNELFKFNKYLQFKKSSYLSINNHLLYFDFYHFVKKTCPDYESFDNNNLGIIKKDNHYLCIDVIKFAQKMEEWFLGIPESNDEEPFRVHTLPLISDMTDINNNPILNVFNYRLNIDDIKHFANHPNPTVQKLCNIIFNEINVIYGKKLTSWTRSELVDLHKYLFFTGTNTRLDGFGDQQLKSHFEKYVKSLIKYYLPLGVEINPYNLVVINYHQNMPFLCDITEILEWFQKYDIDSFKKLPHLKNVSKTPVKQSMVNTKLNPYHIYHLSKHPNTKAAHFFDDFCRNKMGVVYGKEFSKWTLPELLKLNEYI